MGEVRPFLDGYHEERLEPRAVASLENGEMIALTQIQLLLLYIQKNQF